MKYDHSTSRIRPWDSACSHLLSVLRMVHVSAPVNKWWKFHLRTHTNKIRYKLFNVFNCDRHSFPQQWVLGATVQWHYWWNFGLDHNALNPFFRSSRPVTHSRQTLTSFYAELSAFYHAISRLIELTNWNAFMRCQLLAFSVCALYVANLTF